MIMVDLETLGTTPGHCIASIGAVQFEPYLGTVGAEFYTTISIPSQKKYGLKIDHDTFTWWLGQSSSAIGSTFPRQPKHRDLKMALQAFNQFYLTDGQEIWSHGANFDVPFLEQAMVACDMRPAWGYRDVRCSRTVAALADVHVERVGAAHNALSDARFQANYINEVFKELKLMPGGPGNRKDNNDPGK